MLPILDVISFIAGTGVVIALRRSQRRVLVLSAAGAFLGIVLLVVLGIDGWSILRHRTGYRSMPTVRYLALSAVHFWLGHFTMPPIAFFTPLMLAAAVTRASALWRRIVHVILAATFSAGFLLMSFSGYLLPRNIPNPVTEQVAPLVLRFVFIHATVTPCLLLLIGLLIAWRNLAKGRASAV